MKFNSLIDSRTDEDQTVVEMPRKPAQAEKQNDNEQHLDHLKDKNEKITF
jgi:hypothetical protein